MKIYKYGYEEDYPEEDKSMEYGGLIVNGLYLWGDYYLRPELTRVTKYDKEVICDRDI